MKNFSAAWRAVLESPPADQEVDGYERRLEEQEEQQQVDRQERTQASRFEDEDPGGEGFLIAVLVRADERDDEQECRQQHEEQRDPIDTQVPRDAERRDPRMGGDHLVAAVVGLEQIKDRRRDPEHAERRGDADHADRSTGPARDEQRDERRAGRKQDERRQEREGVLSGHTQLPARVARYATSTTTPTATASAYVRT